MTILHISNKPIYPSIDGGCFAMARLLESLMRVATIVDHICIHTTKHPFVEGSYPQNITFALDPKHSFLQTEVHPFAALNALLTGKNYNLSRFHTIDFAAKLMALVEKKHYDCIVFESIYAAVYLNDLRKVTKARMIIRSHNVEHDLWAQQAHTAGFLKKFYLRNLAKSLRREELALLQSADAVWTITDEDLRVLQTAGITTPSQLIRVAVETSGQPSTLSDHFFHLGSMNWEPNRKAVEYLLTVLWPSFFKKNNACRLHLAGSFFSAYPFPETEGVVFHGTVPDAADFMQQQGILIAPITSGSGVRIKILEALSLGIPCITSPLGATGIDIAESGVVVADSETAYIRAMQNLHQSAHLRYELSEKARLYMEKYHSFTAINEQIRQELEC